MIPLPGPSLLIDIGILVEETIFYVQKLGLTKESITKMTESYGLTFEDIQKNVLVPGNFLGSLIGIFSNVGANFFQEGVKVLGVIFFNQLKSFLVKNLGALLTAAAAEEFIKGFFPAIGSLIGAGMSFAITYLSLKHILDNLEESLINLIVYCQTNARK